MTSYSVELTPSGESFTAASDETILDAALRAGVALEYGCRHGNCSSCKYLLTEGEVHHGDASIYSLSEDERDEGYALLCCARPLSPLVVEARQRSDPRARPLLLPRNLDAELCAIEKLTANLWRFSLALSAPLDFYAGQYVELTPPWANARRSYSIASGPAQRETLEFMVKEVRDGAFSSGLATARQGDRYKLSGPFGTSYLRDGGWPVLLCATGSGLAPIAAILHDAITRDDPRQFRFYYGARRRDDVPPLALLTRSREALGERFQFVPSLSAANGDWRGKQGRVTQVLQRELNDADACDAYLCGSPAMCDAVGTLLEAKGIREGHLFYDKFHPAL
jgi:propane monooxygenase reductase subunit